MSDLAGELRLIVRERLWEWGDEEEAILRIANRVEALEAALRAISRENPGTAVAALADAALRHSELADPDSTQWKCPHCGRYEYKPSTECQECGHSFLSPPAPRDEEQERSAYLRDWNAAFQRALDLGLARARAEGRREGIEERDKWHEHAAREISGNGAHDIEAKQTRRRYVMLIREDLAAPQAERLRAAKAENDRLLHEYYATIAEEYINHYD